MLGSVLFSFLTFLPLLLEGCGSLLGEGMARANQALVDKVTVNTFSLTLNFNVQINPSLSCKMTQQSHKKSVA